MTKCVRGTLGITILLFSKTLFAAATPRTEVHPDRSITFRLKAPDASAVKLHADGLSEAVAMVRDAEGVWEYTTSPWQPDLYAYGFTVDGVRVLEPAVPMKHNLHAPDNLLELRGETPQIWERREGPRGRLHRHFYPSPLIGTERELVVYIPSSYGAEPTRVYPVLYLLHGFTDTEDSWTQVGRAHVILDNLIAEGAAVPMIVVMPRGYGNDAVVQPGRGAVSNEERARIYRDSLDRFEASLRGEILPLIERSYRVRTDAEGRALAGLSMGGGQTLLIGMKQPHVFQWLGAFSTGLINDPDQQLVGAGGGDSAPLRLLWIGCGSADPRLRQNLSLVEWLKARQYSPVWSELSGGHNYTVWRRNLIDFLPRLFR